LIRTAMLLDWYLTLPRPKPPTLLWHDAEQSLMGGWQPPGYSANDVRVAFGQLPPPRDCLERRGPRTEQQRALRALRVRIGSHYRCASVTDEVRAEVRRTPWVYPHG